MIQVGWVEMSILNGISESIQNLCNKLLPNLKLVIMLILDNLRCQLNGRLMRFLNLINNGFITQVYF